MVLFILFSILFIAGWLFVSKWYYKKDTKFDVADLIAYLKSSTVSKRIIKSIIIAFGFLVLINLVFLVILMFFWGCDKHQLVINKIKVYPYDNQQQKISFALDHDICFKVDLEITKQKYSLNKVQLVSSAFATPPCKGDAFNSQLKSLKVYTNKTVYFKTNIENYNNSSNYTFLQVLKPNTNLMEITGNHPNYFSFNNTINYNASHFCLQEANEQNESNFYLSENGTSILELSHLPIVFPSGNYTFWFELTLQNGSTFKDSTTFNYTTSEKDFNVNYDTDTSYNHTDSLTTITFHSRDLKRNFDVQFSYFKNGNLAEKAFYIGKKKYGRCIKLFNNGNIKEFSSYGIDGKQSTFPFYSYHPNGALKVVVDKTQINVDRMRYKEIVVNCYKMITYNDSCELLKEEAFSIESKKLIQRSLYKTKELNYEIFYDEEGQKREETIKYDGKYTTTKKFNYAGMLRENWCTQINNYHNINICDRYDDENITREIYVNGIKHAVTDKINLLKLMSNSKYELLLNMKF